MPWFSNDTETKHGIRIKLLEQLKELKVESPVVLSLPATNFKFEKLVRDEYPHSTIHCAEIQRSTFMEVSPLISTDHPIDVYARADILDLMSSSKDYYDFIWADFCGHMSIPIIQRLAKFVSTNMKKGTILAVTFFASREHDIRYLSEEYGVDNAEFRNTVFPSIIESHGQMKNPEFKMTELFDYQSDNGAPMKLYIFKA